MFLNVINEVRHKPCASKHYIHKQGAKNKHGTYDGFWIARHIISCKALLPYVLFAVRHETSATKVNQTERLKTKYVSFYSG
ncbi:hypothetical protein EJP81_13445 [Rahnella aquatilis]|jgi:hypothetical protein|uniref:Uncharacterized protein n=1 Tax=Rahnella sp. (strain Y9602) TaxID=2703885 RepID=A0A0H3FB65_RAHSY|nr:hypothetical protein Rahaq_2803 [Rahnella aceris]AYA07602.1 hypothetical protein D3Z09_14015 [Rahnella aquatilis]MQB54701.1 hypothetical protein [Rahnella sp. RcJ3]AZP42796.1 hypothetical protein EJP79_13440 [Rahnella aquatilis]AZP47135.1 hypothetical protein EJP81_13445 [Rahnella aquatilis]